MSRVRMRCRVTRGQQGTGNRCDDPLVGWQVAANLGQGLGLGVGLEARIGVRVVLGSGWGGEGGSRSPRHRS